MKNRNQHQGFSLVELMISMVLGLILTAGVITLFISSQKTYRTLQQLSEQQENVNFAFRFIEDQVLNIDYLGDCDAGMPVANAVKKGGAAYDAGLLGGLQGFSNGNGMAGSGLLNGTITITDSTTSELPNAIGLDLFSPESDILSVSYLDIQQELTVSGHDETTNQISMLGNKSIEKDQMVALVAHDCSNMALFVQTGDTAVLEHSISSGSLNNCTNFLGGNFTCADTATAVAKAYSSASRAYPVVRNVLGVMPYAAGESSLYIIDVLNGTGAQVKQELVRDVKALNVLYGVGKRTNDGLNVGRYLSAKNIEDSQAVGYAGPVYNWSDVVALQIAITMPDLTDKASNGRIYETTITLRNRVVKK